MFEVRGPPKHIIEYELGFEFDVKRIVLNINIVSITVLYTVLFKVLSPVTSSNHVYIQTAVSS